MMIKKTVLSLSLFMLAMFLPAAPAWADSITLVLSQPTQTGGPGSTLTFDATVSAPLANSATVFLNFDNFGDNIPGSTIDDSGFLINFPLSLNPGGNFTGTLFSVALPPGVAPGSYTGFFEIFGGSNADAGNPLATPANFQIIATPEPGTWVLLATGLGILAMGNFGRRYLPRASAT
jgi:hypothetical protein